MLLSRTQAACGLISPLTLLTIGLLASGLASIELQPGRPFSVDSLPGSRIMEMISRIQVPAATLAAGLGLGYLMGESSEAGAS